jgi:hypothetical protein
MDYGCPPYPYQTHEMASQEALNSHDVAHMGHQGVLGDYSDYMDATDIADGDPGVDEQGEFRTALMLLYPTLVIIGVLSNMLVIVAIASITRLRTGSNMLVLNLCLADIVYCASGVSITPFVLVAGISLRERLFCILIQLISVVSVHVVSLTTMLIAVDRFLRLSASRRPLQVALAVTINISTWLLTTLLCTPMASHINVNDSGQCVDETIDDSCHMQIYTVILLIVQFVIPATVTTVCYIRVTLYFKSPMPSMSAQSGSLIQRAGSQSRNRLKRHKDMLKVSIAIILCFILAFMPSTVLHFVMHYAPSAVMNSFTRLVLTVAVHAISSMSAIANPILYGCLNTTFRRCLIHSHVFRKLCRKGRAAAPHATTNVPQTT